MDEVCDKVKIKKYYRVQVYCIGDVCFSDCCLTWLIQYSAWFVYWNPQELKYSLQFAIKCLCASLSKIMRTMYRNKVFLFMSTTLVWVRKKENNVNSWELNAGNKCKDSYLLGIALD